MNVGFVGMGLMGKRRAASLPPDDATRFYDPQASLLNTGAAFGVPASLLNTESLWSIKEVCEQSRVVVVSVPTHLLADATIECIEHGARRILVEKPCATSAAQMEAIVSHAKKHFAVVIPGYTVRHYPGIVAARAGAERYGKPLHMRIVYGHGGKASGWRADQTKGGGELLDQGSHCIDLATLLLGDDLRAHAACLTRAALAPEANAEDNAFLLLKKDERVAMIHASWTEWAPTFEMRVIFERGAVTVSGLGKTYGAHRVVWHRERGIDEIREYHDAEQAALRHEWDAFLAANHTESMEQLDAALRTIRIIEEAKCMSL